ncbi:aminopeptidase P family protein [Candidatus Daviesbacteria bacterium]|nr:aminopeptidase P family protein [Candidatus Daviesbacteria bacterium]
MLKNSKMVTLKKIITDKKLDGVLVTHATNIAYLTDYYNFSKEEREAYLLITKNSQFILTDGRYSEAIQKHLPDFRLITLTSHNIIDKQLKKLTKTKGLKKVGFEGENLSFLEYQKFSKIFIEFVHLDLSSTRQLKNKEEIAKIKKACQIANLAFKFILKQIKFGISEKDLSYKLELFIKDQKVQFSFPAIVAFGKNSSIPHHQTGNEILNSKNGQFVLLDFGVKFENYCSDMTRTIFFGKASKKQTKIYQTVFNAQQKAIEFISEKLKKNLPILAKDVDKVAREYILSQGFPNIPHSLGHGVGLEVHESPRLSPKSKDILKSGMVFSIEPGIYLKGFGGVRIEDLFTIENNQLIQLTRAAKKLIEL